MSNTHLLLFLLTSLVIIAAPGPDNILVLTRGLTLGRRAALVSAGGAAFGLLGHSLLAAAGLSALLQRSAGAYGAVKYLGAAYLLFLGVRAFLNREHFALAGNGAPLGFRRVFTQAVTSNLLNPKIAVFFLAYHPQFIDPSAGGVSLQLPTFGRVFALLTWGIFSIIAYFSGFLGGWLRRRPQLSQTLGRLTGCAFIILGVRLALPERR